MAILIEVQVGVCGIERSSDWGMKSVSRLFFVLFVLFVFMTPIFASVALAEINENAAALAIDGAEASVFSAYQAVLEAEKDGADVSGLLVRLNDAAELLAKAHIAYDLEQFDEAAGFADLCSEVGEAVKSDAVELWVETQGSRVWELWLALDGSLVVVVVVVFAGFLGWGYVKKRYATKVFEMKPEVSEG